TRAEASELLEVEVDERGRRAPRARRMRGGVLAEERVVAIASREVLPVVVEECDRQLELDGGIGRWFPVPEQAQLLARRQSDLAAARPGELAARWRALLERQREIDERSIDDRARKLAPHLGTRDELAAHRADHNRDPITAPRRGAAA